jgi:hypothetical protein
VFLKIIHPFENNWFQRSQRVPHWKDANHMPIEDEKDCSLILTEISIRYSKGIIPGYGV